MNIFAHKVAGAPFVHTTLLTDDDRSGIFHDYGQLPVGHGHWAAGYENTGSACRRLHLGMSITQRLDISPLKIS